MNHWVVAPVVLPLVAAVLLLLAERAAPRWSGAINLVAITPKTVSRLQERRNILDEARKLGSDVDMSIDLAKDRPNADGICRGWFDGKLVVEHTDVIFRSTDYPKMQFNQFLLAPFFGSGLVPHPQKLWIDELEKSFASFGSGEHDDAAAFTGQHAGGALIVRTDVIRSQRARFGEANDFERIQANVHSPGQREVHVAMGQGLTGHGNAEQR